MTIMKKFVSICLMLFLVFAVHGYVVAADESQFFGANVQPDALILLDLSGSMAWNPAGGSNKWGNSSCTGTFYSSSGSGHTYDCSRVAIAKRAICNMLDANNNGCSDGGDGIIDTPYNITTDDETALKVRIGYMRFYDGTSGYTACNPERNGTYSYSSGCNSIIQALNTNNKQIGDGGYSPNYSTIWSSVRAESARGGTPDAAALAEAKLYLDYHKTTDNASACRKKFVILITDGADTYACNGNGSENQSTQYKRRRELVAKAKDLADKGYKVFVIGFGSGMPDYLENTLNWAAYYGGTDNPDAANSGSTSGYNIPSGSLYPSGVSSCSTSMTTGSCPNCYATSNDPGNTSLSGYAFLASNADELSNALKNAMSIIASSYSFTASSMSTARISNENNTYEGSFTPQTSDPFWFGDLKKYTINSDGSIGSKLWSAGSSLAGKDHASRSIWTYKGSLTAFSTGNITPQDVGKASGDTAGRDLVVNYIRGNPSYNPDAWKLGDIWHSNPLVITSPSPYFVDQIDGGNAFESFRTNHQRPSGGGRVVVAGANDGQFHAFDASNGNEYFSFIPPNLLPKLKSIAHSSHPTSLTHQFFVDGPTTAADVWLGSGSGTSKSSSDWKTLVIFGLGRGVTSTGISGEPTGYLWSASSNCIPTSSTAPYGYSLTYTSGYTYCGYYAFDFTTTTSPAWKWKLNPTSSDNAYLGEPWSQMAIGRVKISGNEKWVGFIGGGDYTRSSCTGSSSPPDSNFGRGFFVVDLSNGSIIWRYTAATNSDMKRIPAPPAIIDTDNDGFVDAAYVGDTDGNMWRFKFCKGTDTSSCGTGSWTGGKLFDASGHIRPIYSGAAIAKDTSGNMWVYWGSGDKQCPSSANQERFFAIKDDGGSYSASNLDNITSGTYSDAANKHGWYIQFTGQETVLSEPSIFGGGVYFTTFTPPSGSSNPCAPSGSSNIYGLDYITGGGKLSGEVRSQSAGAGIASSPTISVNPEGTGASLFVNVSGADPHITKLNLSLSMPSNKSNILYWKDRRSN